MIKNLKFKIKNCQGFTLIEILIAVSIFVMVAGMVVGIFITNSKIQSKTQALRETSQSLRYALEGIGREVQLADGCYLNDTDPNNKCYPIYTSGPICRNQPWASGQQETLLVLFKTDKSTNQCIVHRYYLQTNSTGNNPRIDLMVEVDNNFPSAGALESAKTLNSTSVSIPAVTINHADATNANDQTFTYNQTYYSSLNRQPSVRINIQGQYIAGIKQAEQAQLEMQTTFTTRNYPGFNDIAQ